MADVLPITVVIPVLNEEQSMAFCLERLKRFAHVVVVDSGSTDRTCEIAGQHKAEVILFRWDGKFPKKRNWVLRNHPPSTPWVLFLDADEWIDDAVCNELAATLPATTHNGFWMTYDNWFLGRRLRHGTPNRKLALFRVGSGEYERIDENRWSELDMEIHEHPVLSGSIGSIHARIEHRDDRGLEHWQRRHAAYAAWEANRTRDLRASGASLQSDRQGRKYQLLGKWWLPAVYFLDSYVRRLGFLDGSAGFLHAWYKARYFAQIGRLLKQSGGSK